MFLTKQTGYSLPKSICMKTTHYSYSTYYLKILTTVFCCCIIYSPLPAQDVISNGGDFTENNYGSLSWTIGESLSGISTIGGDIQLTEGFHQPTELESAVVVQEIPSMGFGFKLLYSCLILASTLWFLLKLKPFKT